MTAMKGLDTKRLAKSIGTAEARPNGRCHTLLCLLSALKQSSEKNSQMTDLSLKATKVMSVVFVFWAEPEVCCIRKRSTGRKTYEL